MNSEKVTSRTNRKRASTSASLARLHDLFNLVKRIAMSMEDRVGTLSPVYSIVYDHNKSPSTVKVFKCSSNHKGALPQSIHSTLL